MSVSTLTPDDLDRIFSYLEEPVPQTLPTSPLQFLADHIHVLPPPLLAPFGRLTTPRQRASIQTIKSRRLIHASQVPTPRLLTAERGRLRWPLLWERMGGARLPPPTADVEEEEDWVRDNFLPGKENAQHVKKLGGFLRGLEEEREMEGVVMAKRAERRLDDVGEEFDEESDEEEEAEDRPPLDPDHINEDEQREVREAFEKRILELFVDGMDTVPYDEVDFTEPVGGDPIAFRDQEDSYFDDQDPSKTPNGHEQGEGETSRSGDADDRSTQNGQGEYDY